MSNKEKPALEQLQDAHNELYKKLYEHYMALRRLMEHAIISIDTSCQILLDGAEENKKAKDDVEKEDG